MLDLKSVSWEVIPFRFEIVPNYDELVLWLMGNQVAQMGENLSTERGKLRPLSTPCGGNVFELHNRVDRSVSPLPSDRGAGYAR